MAESNAEATGTIEYVGFSRIPEALPTTMELDRKEVGQVATWLTAVEAEIAGLTRKASLAGFPDVAVSVVPEKGSTLVRVAQTKEVEEPA